jgi:hypothetical protein
MSVLPAEADFVWRHAKVRLVPKPEVAASLVDRDTSRLANRYIPLPEQSSGSIAQFVHELSDMLGPKFRVRNCQVAGQRDLFWQGSERPNGGRVAVGRLKVEELPAHQCNLYGQDVT